VQSTSNGFHSMSLQCLIAKVRQRRVERTGQADGESRMSSVDREHRSCCGVLATVASLQGSERSPTSPGHAQLALTCVCGWSVDRLAWEILPAGSKSHESYEQERAKLRAYPIFKMGQC
jgi:hypothetical protein